MSDQLIKSQLLLVSSYADIGCLLRGRFVLHHGGRGECRHGGHALSDCGVHCVARHDVAFDDDADDTHLVGQSDENVSDRVNSRRDSSLLPLRVDHPTVQIVQVRHRSFCQSVAQ